MTTSTATHAGMPLPKLRAVAALSAIAIAFAAIASLGPDAARSAAADPAAIVERVVAQTCEAFRTGDAAALDRLLDARYTLVSSSGEVTGKAEQLARARAMQTPGTVRVRDVEVRIDGDSAIAVGILALRTADGAPRELRFTEVLVADAGEWRVAATHVSGLR